MKKVFFLVFALVLISWGQASADAYSFHFAGPAITADGTLNAVSNGTPDGSFTAISGSGFANGVAITLLPNLNGTGNAYSPTGYFSYDNQLFPTADPLIDVAGLLFTAAYAPYNGTFGTTEINLYGNGAGAPYTYYENTGYNENGAFTLTGDSEDPGTGTSVPEPGSMLLLGFGLVGLVGFRRKFKK